MLKNRLQDKHLIALLATLSIMIVALIVGIVVVNLNKTDLATEDEEEEYPLYWDGMSEEEFNDARLVEKSRNVEAEVQKLLNQQPVDVKKINELYEEEIALAKELDREDYVLIFNLDRKDSFMNKEMYKEALDAMLTMDFDSYLAPSQYRLYSIVIDLAEKVGDTEVAEEYEALRKKVEAAYLEDYNATAESVSRGDDIYLDMPIVDEEEE